MRFQHSFGSSGDKLPAKVTLWGYLISMRNSGQDTRVDTVFKAKNPKRFIQVKTSLINNAT